MMGIAIILVIGIVGGIGVYQIYLDSKEKKSNCPCGGNCKCNE